MSGGHPRQMFSIMYQAHQAGWQGLNEDSTAAEIPRRLPGMREVVRNFSAFAVVLAILPVTSEFFIELARSYGAYDDPQAKLRNLLDMISGIASHWLYPWIAGGVLGFCIGVWLDWFLKKRESNGVWVAPMNVNAEVQNALELIFTHVGELGGDSYISNARSKINSHLVNYVDEPHTQSILKAIKHGCYLVSDAGRFSVSQAEKSRIENVLRECCRLLLDNFDKRPSRRNDVCRKFIQIRKETLPQEPTDTEAEKPGIT